MENKEVFLPIMEDEANTNVIPSHMFVKEKIDNGGNRIKWKARLVAGGHRQIRNESLDTSSPTANKSNLMMMISIAADQNKIIATADIKGAYLNAPMKNDIYMKLDNQLSKNLISINREYSNFLNKNGNLTVKLNKALYGCIESSKLWYDYISNYITSIGFTKSKYDDCFFFKNETNSTITHIALYVDDIIITSSTKEYIKHIENNLKDKFDELTFNYGMNHQFLGMELDFSNPSEVNVSMKNKISQLLNEFEITNIVPTPANNNLFKCNEDLPLLDESKQRIIRSAVAKLLYLSINVRYDISLPVNYLCTRAEKYTSEDEVKLNRILEYLNGTKNHKLKLKINNSKTISSYIDASFGIRVIER